MPKFHRIVADLVANSEEQWNAGCDLHLDTLDVYLLDCLEGDFNVEFEDDRVVTAVSVLLQTLYRDCAAGDLESGRRLLSGLTARAQVRVAGEVAGGGSVSGSEEEGEGEGGAAPPAPPEKPAAPRRVVDAEGWETIVVKPKKGGKGAAPAATAMEEDA